MTNLSIDSLSSRTNQIQAQLTAYHEQWDNFFHGDHVDPAIIPNPIYASWVRSRDLCASPYEAYNLYVFLDTADSFESTKRFIAKYEFIFSEMAQIAEANEFEFLVTDPYMQSIFHSESLTSTNDFSTQKVIAGYDCTEKKLGTSAMYLALRKNDVAQVIGAQHYNKTLHNTHCTASPLHNSQGETIAVINLLSKNMNRIEDGLVLTKVLAELFSLRTNTNQQSQAIPLSLMVKVTEEFNSGIIWLTSENAPLTYNKKIQALLSLSQDREIALQELTEWMRPIRFDQLESRNITIQNKANTLQARLIEIYDEMEQNHIRLLTLTKIGKNADRKDISQEKSYCFDDIIGMNPQLKKAKSLAKRVAKTHLPILIFGETGTGKEMFAQAIHDESPRKHKPFVAINCGALPIELVESELFGYEAGSFTGALKGGKKGKIEAAEGGTLFLDEIESMPMIVQIKLLRALSTHTIVKIGGTKTIPIDVRIVSATKKDLLKEADLDKFREDLYYRISTFTLALPPLRERRDDIKLLLDHFTKESCIDYNCGCTGYSDHFVRALEKYYWRGNVREFTNVIQRAIVLAEKNKPLDLEQLPTHISSAYQFKRIKEEMSSILSQPLNNNAFKMAEEILIRDALESNQYNIQQSADLLGVSRSTLYKKIETHPKLIALKKKNLSIHKEKD